MQIRQLHRKKTKNKIKADFVRLYLITSKEKTMDNYYNRYADPGFYLKRDAQKKEIRTLGFYVGLALISQIIMQNVLAFGINIGGLTDKYLTDGVFQNGMDIIITFLSFLLPYFFIGQRMKKISGVNEPVPLGKPVDGLSFILAVVAGIGFCMIANIITSYLTVILSVFGIELSSPDIPMPSGPAGVITTVIRVAVVAAVSEEITLRGYVMGNLRKYGDKFAILASALVFAVMHGNLVQAPFALIAGFGLGYLSIKTGTVWTGITIHAANNFISVAISYAMESLPEETVNIIYTFVLYGFILFGLIALSLLRSRKGTMKLREENTLLTTAEKAKAFFLNPAMIIALCYMLYITAQYVGFGFKVK